MVVQINLNMYEPMIRAQLSPPDIFGLCNANWKMHFKGAKDSLLEGEEFAKCNSKNLNLR